MRAGRWKGEKKVSNIPQDKRSICTEKICSTMDPNIVHAAQQYQTYISEKKKWISLIRDVDNSYQCCTVPMYPICNDLTYLY